MISLLQFDNEVSVMRLLLRKLLKLIDLAGERDGQTAVVFFEGFLPPPLLVAGE
jgi:hypothetical protein